MKTADRVAKRDHFTRVQRLARKRADDQARRIPWQRLLEARSHYIDWQEFYLWVRSTLEVEDGIPNWLVGILDIRCPGFHLAAKTDKTRPLHLRLEDWIDEHIFGFAKKEGWFNAITYYAVRDPRYQRAEVCWSECIEKWRKVKPERYPTFQEWKEIAVQCDPIARLAPQERAAQAGLKLVDPGRLSEAISRYIDWEALAYWARPALECGRTLPEQVMEELNRRCPGFLWSRSTVNEQTSSGSAQGWERLMLWTRDHFFQDPKSEGWFDAILIQVRNHPRAIRTMEFADHCGEVWSPKLPDPYPPFADWRRDADQYVESPG